MTRTDVPGAIPSTSAPTANRPPANSSVGRRPMRSAITPATSAPTSAPRVTKLVMISVVVVETWKLSSMPRSAPEITPWS